MKFENKVVLVTGSGSGIGEAVAILFAKEGANVVIVDCNEETANETGEKCKEFGKSVLVIKSDISKPEEAKNAIDRTIDKFGHLDVLINNAGIVRQGDILSGTIMNTYDEVLNTNLRSVVLMTSMSSTYLTKTKGCIINTSSVLSTEVLKGRKYPAYTISKVGIDVFTRLSAAELGPLGVRVNAVNPGPVYTNLLSNAGLHTDWDNHTKATTLRKGSDPQEVAELIVYLASDKARSITGGTYLIDNGKSLV